MRDPAEARNLTLARQPGRRQTNGTRWPGRWRACGVPVMEGKAVLFKKFAGIDCLTSSSTSAIPTSSST